MASMMSKIISRTILISSQSPSSLSWKHFKCRAAGFLQQRRNFSAESATEKEKEIQIDENSSYTASKEFLQAYVPMPISAVQSFVIGKRFYKGVSTRLADDSNGWTVMLDYRTLKTPSKRPLKFPTLHLANAVAAEWEYQIDGLMPFTMPLMRLCCTALERVPLTREKIIVNLMRKFHTDLVFCRAPEEDVLINPVNEAQVKYFDPLLDWMETELGFRPIMYTSIFAGKQPPEVFNAMEKLLRKTSNWELAAIDSLAAATHSLTISFALFRGRLDAKEAIRLSRLEEDLQVDRWGLVEGGHDIDIADLQVQVYSASSFLNLLNP